MNWKTVTVATLAACMIGLGASNASAQYNGEGAGRWEITGFPGGGMFFTSQSRLENSSFQDYGLGGSFTLNVNRYFGVEGEIAGGLGATQNLRVVGERLVSQSVPRTLTYTGNGVYSPFGSDRSLVPYATGGIGGLTMFSRNSVADLGVTRNQSFFTGNVGGGLKWFANERFGVRGDYRLIAVRSKDSGPAFFARDDVRYGHRIYGGVIITGGR